MESLESVDGFATDGCCSVKVYLLPLYCWQNERGRLEVGDLCPFNVDCELRLFFQCDGEMWSISNMHQCTCVPDRGAEHWCDVDLLVEYCQRQSARGHDRENVMFWEELSQHKRFQVKSKLPQNKQNWRENIRKEVTLERKTRRSDTVRSGKWQRVFVTEKPRKKTVWKN